MVTSERLNGDRYTHALTGRYKDVLCMCDFGYPIPLYTTPPAQPWQSLTDEEIDEILSTKRNGWVTWGEISRAIEAKLMEKNTIYECAKEIRARGETK